MCTWWFAENDGNFHPVAKMVAFVSMICCERIRDSLENRQLALTLRITEPQERVNSIHGRERRVVIGGK